MSAPAAKALSLPVMTMAPMSGSLSRSSSASPKASIRASLRALSCAGRFRVMSPTRPWRASRMGDSDIARSCLLDGDFLVADQRAQNLAFVDQQGLEFGRVERDVFSAEVGIARFQGRRGQGFGHLTAQAFGDVGGGIVGRPHAKPDVQVRALEALLGHSGHIREEG